MTTGNTAAVTVSQANMAADNDPEECEKLKIEADAEDARIQKVRTTTKAARAHKATTVTASKLTCGGASNRTPAYSSLSRLPTKMRKRYAKGVKSGSNMCQKDGKPFQHAKSGFSSGCTHTEARLIEDAFGKPGGAAGCEMVMKIKWKQRTLVRDASKKVIAVLDDPPLDIPCGDCEKVICHAKFCGLKIYLCQDGDDGKQKKSEPPDCTKHGY